MKTFISIISLLFLSLSAFSQDPLAHKQQRKFNIGLYMGIGGTQPSFFPSLDVRFHRTNFRLSPAPDAFGCGISQEIYKFNPHINVVGSFAYIYGTENIHLGNVSSYHLFGLLSGFKIYMGNHFYTQAQIGVRYVDSRTLDYQDDNYFKMYYEFGIGYKLFKNFH
jgi:hypothetical protein